MPPATVTVTDHFQDGAGNPLAGRVIFRPSVTVKLADATVPPAPIVAKLNGTGDLNVVLLANNGPGVTPVGWTYEVTLMVGPPGSHGDLGIDAWTREVWHISLPQSPSSVILRNLTPVETVRPVQFEVLSVSGKKPDIGGDVDLTATDLELNGVGFAAKATVDALDTRVDALELAGGSYLTEADLGAPSGVASLDSGSKLPVAQLPALTKSMVGLSDVDNTTDLAKPLSTAAIAALAGKAATAHTHAIADVTSLQGALDDGANFSPESATLGDFMASIPRFAASSQDTLSNQVLSLSGGIAMRSFTATKLRFHVRGVLGSPGIVTMCLFKGAARNNLAKVLADTVVTASFAAIGIKEFTFSNLAVAKGEWVYLAMLHTNGGTDPAMSTLASAPSSDLLNPSSTQVICGFKTAQTSLPASVDMTTGWTIYNRIIWFALAP